MSERAFTEWNLIYPGFTEEMLGLIPMLLWNSDPRPAREQLHERYAHGGGWSPFQGFVMTETGIKYPGDPEMKLYAETKLRDETIRLYECAWVAIVQPDGSYEISRMD